MVKIAEKYYTRIEKSNNSITLIRFHRNHIKETNVNRNHIKVLLIRFLLEKICNLPNLLNCSGTLSPNIAGCLHFLLCVFKPLFNNKNEHIFILDICFLAIWTFLKWWVALHMLLNWVYKKMLSPKKFYICNWSVKNKFGTFHLNMKGMLKIILNYYRLMMYQVTWTL